MRKFALLSLTVTAIACAIIVIGAYTISTNQPNQTLGQQTFSKKILPIAEIIGIDASKYNVNLDSYRQSLFFNILPEETAEYTFTQGKDKIKMKCIYVNDELYTLTVNVDDQSSLVRSVGDNFEMAQTFLKNYQAFSGAAYYTEMQQMLVEVEPNKDVIKTLGNIKLEITYEKNVTKFLWTYINQDAEVPLKNVALYFDRGVLKSFTDRWGIYKISNNNVVLSKQDAVDVAKASVQSYLRNASPNEKNMNVFTEFKVREVIEARLYFENAQNAIEIRGEDRFTLYPIWRIQLRLDESYLDNVYGFDVGIWADTQEVYFIYPMRVFGF